jgi:branched-chain amino acid aminotransferase
LIAEHLGIPTREREVDLTELYIADEVFACGTSTYVTPVTEVDARTVNGCRIGPVTERIRERYSAVLRGEDAYYRRFVTRLG